MKPNLKLLLLVVFASILRTSAQTSTKLSGTVIGTQLSVNYSNGSSSTTVNTKDNVFDGNMDTYFASYDRSRTWVGLDLGKQHVITKVGWSPRNDSNGPKRVQLAVFEGANQADFSDAVPLYLNDLKGTIGKMDYADVNVSQGFRYVRYVGPNDARCNLAELEFYGYEGEGEKNAWYRPTNLPLVSVHVKNAQEPYDKEHELECNVVLIPSDPNDAVKMKTATIRLRGNASMNFEKKPYRIKFEKKDNVFGSPASAKKWTLINNYGDKTLMRNILAFDLSRRFEMEYTPFIQAVDVIVNGEYKGCYQLCDQVEVKKGRVDIDEMDETCISGEALTGGYLIEVDAYADGEPVHFKSQRGNPVTIKSPDSDIIQQVQKNYIQNYFNKMETALYASNFTSENGYRKYLHLESFLKHFLVGEFSGNTDTYWSVNMYKRRGDDLLYVGPVWDFDLAYENDNRTHPINNLSDYIYYTKGSCAGNMRDFVSRIVRRDSGAQDELSAIWAEARGTKGVDEETLLALVDDLAEELNASQRLNFMRWPILSTYVHQNWQASGSYEKEVQIVKDYIKKRIVWMDKKLHYDPSGIDDVAQNEDESSPFYSIDGRRLGCDANNLSRGVYVRNGKKILIR